MNLDSRTILITGGGSGLGLACADAVADAGGAAIVLDRSVAGAQDYPCYEVDVRDAAEVDRVVSEIAAHRGIDGIITAAGIDRPGDLDEVSPAQWDEVLAVNLLGTVYAVRAAMPHLKQSGGRVVTVSSTLALKGAGGATAYCASKFGVRGFSQALAAETAGAVGVTNVIPGGMKTRFFDGRTERFMPKDDSTLNDPARVADAIVFALTQPPGVEIREILIAHEEEDSWP